MIVSVMVKSIGNYTSPNGLDDSVHARYNDIHEQFFDSCHYFFPFRFFLLVCVLSAIRDKAYAVAAAAAAAAAAVFFSTGLLLSGLDFWMFLGGIFVYLYVKHHATQFRLIDEWFPCGTSECDSGL
jgi:fatty acid desaturase